MTREVYSPRDTQEQQVEDNGKGRMNHEVHN